MEPTPPRVTQLLARAKAGDKKARNRLLRSIYDELRKRAQVYLDNERRGHTLEATALVHEVYIRVLEGEDLPGQNRAQLLCYLSRAMRHILVDHARSRRRIKRGGVRKRLQLTESMAISRGQTLDLLALDDALKSLAQVDSRKSRVVELKYFGGLSVAEIAEALSVSPSTVKHDWEVAKAWLLHDLRKGDFDAR